MGFPRTARPQFTEVEIIFHKRNHPCQEQPFFPVGQRIRFHTSRTQHDVQPFFLGKGLAAALQFVHIDMGHLDWREITDTDGINVLLLPVIPLRAIFTGQNDIQVLRSFCVIIQLYDAPYTAAQKAVVFFRVFISNGDSGQAQIGK